MEYIYYIYMEYIYICIYIYMEYIYIHTYMRASCVLKLKPSDSTEFQNHIPKYIPILSPNKPPVGCCAW